MSLDDYIELNQHKIIETWKVLAVERLSLDLEESELVDALPHFIDDIVAALRSPSKRWPHPESAESHGRHRMRSGLDIGALTEEMALIGEAILESAFADNEQVSRLEMLVLIRVIGRGAAASVTAYAAMRDAELARQAAQHFSFLAHEIRNPLQDARLAGRLLATDLEKERSNGLRRLDRALSQLSDLVDNSLMEARFSLEPNLGIERSSVANLVETACKNAIDRAKSRNISMDVQVEQFDLDVDRKVLVSALTNLLVNAVKFCAEGKRVVIRARAAEDRAIFEVEDQCGGIPEDLLPRLFQPFSQVGSDRSGFGLGLMIVKQAAESHGGGVRVFNHPPVGCCFVVDLPRYHSGSA